MNNKFSGDIEIAMDYEPEILKQFTVTLDQFGFIRNQHGWMIAQISMDVNPDLIDTESPYLKGGQF